MTTRDVDRCIARWQVRLGLQAWRLTFEPGVEPDDDNIVAQFRYKWDYDEAAIRLKGDWKLWDEQKLEETICHELLHAVLRDVEHAVVKTIGADEGPGNVAYDHAIEGAIDRLSRAFVALV
jgi:hypothetical protein